MSYFEKKQHLTWKKFLWMKVGHLSCHWLLKFFIYLTQLSATHGFYSAYAELTSIFTYNVGNTVWCWLYINSYWRNLAFRLIFWTSFNSIVLAIGMCDESLFPDLVCVCSYKYCIIMWHILWRQHYTLQTNLRIFDRHIPDIIHIIVGDCDSCILSCTVYYDIWMYMYFGITSMISLLNL